MSRRIKNPLRRFVERRDSMVFLDRSGSAPCRLPQESPRMRCLASLLLLTFTTPAVLAQEKSQQPPLKGLNAAIVEMLHTQQQPPAPVAKRSVTLADAVAIFLQHNLQLVAGRYDIETADAEKLTARLRPNPEFSFNSDQLPLDFSGPFFKEQEITYSISQTFETGGKRHKRIDAANANAELARAEF